MNARERLARHRESKRAADDAAAAPVVAAAPVFGCGGGGPAKKSTDQLGSYRAAHAERNAKEVAAAPLAWWSVLPLWQKAASWGTSLGAALIVDALQTWIIVAGFVLVYVYTREDTAKNRQPGQKSAYSVFNEGCEKIDGTYDAEQFDKGLRSGFGMMG